MPSLFTCIHTTVPVSIVFELEQNIDLLVSRLRQQIIMAFDIHTARSAGELLIAQPIYIGVCVYQFVREVHEVLPRLAL